jgi:hypothetical protein
MRMNNFRIIMQAPEGHHGDGAVATRRLVQQALQLAEEARFLEEAKMISEAVDKYAQAVCGEEPSISNSSEL